MAKALQDKTKGHKVDAGWSSPVARQAHNLKVVSSNLAPATKFTATSKSPRSQSGGFSLAGAHGKLNHAGELDLVALPRSRIWVSSWFLRHDDKPQILLSSQLQICAIGADGGQACIIRGI
jgi:hypothetical protein